MKNSTVLINSCLGRYTKFTTIALTIILLTCTGCSKKEVITGKIFRSFNIDISINYNEKSMLYIFTNDEKTLYIADIGPKTKFLLPDWAMDPDNKTIVKNHPETKYLEESDLDKKKAEGKKKIGSGNSLVIPFEKASEMATSLYKSYVMTFRTGKHRYAIIPGKEYEITVKEHSTDTVKKHGKNITVHYVDIVKIKAI